MACASKEKKLLWRDRILSQRDSGLSVATWCSHNNIRDHLFYYWQNRLFPKPALKRSSFTELMTNDNKSKPGITLEFKEFSIHLSQDFDPITLKQCIEVLRSC